MIVGLDYDEYGGADAYAYANAGEWSCGNVPALMVLHHFGNTDFTEMELAEIMQSSTYLDIPGSKPGSANNFYEYGTDVKQLTGCIHCYHCGAC